MTTMLERLTPEQEAMLPVFRDFGLRIGLSTERTDRDKADAAIRAMDRTDVMELLRSAVALLDGALDSLGEAARLEARREAGKPMRSITHMHRYEAARKMVERGYAILGWEDAHD